MGWGAEIEWDDWQPQRVTMLVFAVLTVIILALWWDFVRVQAVCGAIVPECAVYRSRLAPAQLGGLLLLGELFAFLGAGGIVRLWEEAQAYRS